MKLRLANEDIELLPQKAFYWHSQRLLGLSDVHLGKAESYQHAGVPIPSGDHRDDLARIANLVESLKAQKVVVLGDWIHNRFSLSSPVREDLHVFFKEFSHVHWTLLLGNHERGAYEALQDLPFHMVVEDLRIGPFLFTHGHKYRNEELFQIQGHTHPLIAVHEGPLRLKLPCFLLEKNCLTIPAFGSLTGGYAVRPGKSDRVFAIANGEIFEIRPRLSGRR